MDFGIVLAADIMSDFMFCRQEKWLFWYKSTVQCRDELNHKIALKSSKN